MRIGAIHAESGLAGLGKGELFDTLLEGRLLGDEILIFGGEVGGSLDDGRFDLRLELEFTTQLRGLDARDPLKVGILGYVLFVSLLLDAGVNSCIHDSFNLYNY